MRVRKRNQEEKRDKTESRRELSGKIRKIQKSIRKEITGRGLEIFKKWDSRNIQNDLEDEIISIS